MDESKSEKLANFISSMEALSSALDEFFGLVEKAAEDYKQALKDGSESDIEDALESFMFSQYQYMRSKFNGLWYEDINLERGIYRHVPSISMFGALDFEFLIQSLLYILQDKYYTLTSTSYDGGIDLEFRENFYFGNDIVGFGNYYAQCKLYRGNVPVAHIRDFFGVITNQAAEGYFFTTGIISSSGKKFIESANKSSYSNKLYFADKQTLKVLLEMADEVVAVTEALMEIDYTTGNGQETFDTLWKQIKRIKLKSKEVMSPKQPTNFQRKLFE